MGKCTNIHSPKKNSLGSDIYLVGVGLFFSLEPPLFVQEKSWNICTFIVSTGKVVILPVATDCTWPSLGLDQVHN